MSQRAATNSTPKMGPIPDSSSLWRRWLFLFIFVFLILRPIVSAKLLHQRFAAHSTPEVLTQIANLSNPDRVSVKGDLLAPLLVPRVSGTEGNTKVQQFIIKTLKDLNWHIEEDKFSDNTPYGVKPFNNIIATKDPSAPRKLVLAAHFDSKYFKDFDFIAATDSAVPCAILLDIAASLNDLLEKRLEQTRFQVEQAGNVEGAGFPTIQLIFFDGEEAFVQWTSTDSVYGSRHLAEKWEKTFIVPYPSSETGGGGAGSSVSVLSTIDVFVLLDLLGAKDTIIYNYHTDTSWMYDRIVDIQQRLFEESLLSEHMLKTMDEGEEGYFKSSYSINGNYVDDDHKPFMTRGVPVVHVIPNPFPSVWHKKSDNADAISHDVTKDFALIFRVLVAEYLGLYIQ